MHRSSLRRKDHFRLDSFTLIELLTVIAIIAILAGLTLGAAGGVMKSAARNKAKAEIAAISGSLENYKVDNGGYPLSSSLLGPPDGTYPIDPSTPGGLYQVSSQALYQALAGKTNFTDVSNTKYYMSFKTGQLGNYKSGVAPTYIQDPFGFSYGYSTGDTKSPQTSIPFLGTGFFDLWSTGGTTQVTTSNPNPTNTWISNWQQQ